MKVDVEVRAAKAVKHILRPPFYVNAKDFRRYPAACPICKVDEGLHCKSLYSGERVHSHRDRPMR